MRRAGHREALPNLKDSIFFCSQSFLTKQLFLSYAAVPCFVCPEQTASTFDANAHMY